MCLLFGHAWAWWLEPTRVRLKCGECGTLTPGWAVPPRRWRLERFRRRLREAR